MSPQTTRTIVVTGASRGLGVSTRLTKEIAVPSLTRFLVARMGSTVERQPRKLCHCSSTRSQEGAGVRDPAQIKCFHCKSRLVKVGDFLCMPSSVYWAGISYPNKLVTQDVAAEISKLNNGKIDILIK